MFRGWLREPVVLTRERPGVGHRVGRPRDFPRLAAGGPRAC